MEKIDLTVRYTPEGAIIPQQFTGNKGTVQIRDIGRRWKTAEGNHILVMDYQNQTYHLFYEWESSCWYLVRDRKPSRNAT